jgi:hypothetical protein
VVSPIFQRLISTTEKRQNGEYETMLYNLFGVNKSPAEIDFFTKKLGKPEVDPKAVREKVMWGPFKLQPANGTHTAVEGLLKLDKMSDVFSSRVKGMCRNCQILYAQGDVTDKNGKKVSVQDGVYSHHVIMSDVGRTMVPMPAVARCPDGKIGGFNFNPATMLAGMGGSKEPKAATAAVPKGGMAKGGHSHKKRQFGPEIEKIMSDLLQTKQGIDTFVTNMPPISILIGGGDDGSATRFAPPAGSKLKTGFYVSPKDSINLMAEIVNYDNKVKEVYVTLDYEYIPNLPSKPTDIFEVGMAAINVAPCAGTGGDLLCKFYSYSAHLNRETLFPQ